MICRRTALVAFGAVLLCAAASSAAVSNAAVTSASGSGAPVAGVSEPIASEHAASVPSASVPLASVPLTSVPSASASGSSVSSASVSTASVSSASAPAGSTSSAGVPGEAVPAAAIPVFDVTAGDAGYTVVTLSSTLDVPSGATVQNTRFIWAGPAGVPMLRLAGASFAHLEHLAFDVAGGRHATAAVELVSTPGGGPLGDSLADLRIGTPGERVGLDYGIRWTGQLNGDSNTFTNIGVFGVGTAGVSVDNPQATGNSLRSLYVFNSPIGLQTAAGGTITCDNCGFIGSTDVDLELTGGAGLIVTGLYSEGSHSFARVAAGPGGGGLSVAGGYWQHGPRASGATITGQQMCCYRSWVRLTDFIVTPLSLTPAGTVVGVPAGKLFLTNVAGIAG